jgi:hypothetical protein
MKASIAERIQAPLRLENLDGWPFCSFRGSDGEPAKLVHSIESEMLDTLPGKKKVWFPWQQIHSHLTDILSDSRRADLQYSPLNAISCISRADAGTVELVRCSGVDAASSSVLVRTSEAAWTAEQVETHLDAAGRLRKIVDWTLGEIARRIRTMRYGSLLLRLATANGFFVAKPDYMFSY